MRHRFAGVIGASQTSEEIYKIAEETGKLLAKEGFIIVCGGLGGVMEACAKGARHANGDVIGILPGSTTSSANPYITHPIATNMGHARNIIIAHTADFLVAISGGTGTLSEIAIGLKLGKVVFSMRSWNIPDVVVVADPQDLIDKIKAMKIK